MSPAEPLQAVAREFRGRLKADELDELWAVFSRLQFGWASTELQVCWFAGVWIGLVWLWLV